MKELKPRDKITQKMTRDGLIQENKATGETERISAREKEPVLFEPQQDAAATPAAMPQPGKIISGKPPLPLSPDGTRPEEKQGAAERVIDRLEIEQDRHVNKRMVKKANEEIRTRQQSSRLQFTDEERAAPVLAKHIRKSDKAADRLDAARAKIPKKKKPVIERTFDEAKARSKVRLRFKGTDKPLNGKMRHNPANRPMQEIGVAIHGKIHQMEKDNSGVEGAHKTEQLAERTARTLRHGGRSRKLKPYSAAAKAEKKAFRANTNALYKKALRDNPQLANTNPLSKVLQKRKIRKEYAKAVRSGTAQGAKAAAATAKKTVRKATETAQKTAAFVARHWKGIGIALAVILIFVLLFAGLSSFGSILQGGFTSIIGTSYTAEDADIITVDESYAALENGLREQIGRIESDYPNYDEYRYSLDEIGHNPFELASYLTAKYHDYTPAEVQAELQALFEQQYSLTLTEEIEVRYRTETYTDTWTETDPETGEITTHTDTYTVEVPYNYYILNVTLKNKSLTSVAATNMDTEQREMYGVYLETMGNKPYLFAENIYAHAGEYTDYDIPPNALADPDFAALIAEAEKYLGYPYVWGGSKPSTSFDCSGYVCWVLNQSGVASVGRTNARGLYRMSTVVSSANAQPGDLIFFTGARAAEIGHPVTHVGIYVGNGMMIHCASGGVQYASINTSYWTKNFYAFGRLP